MIIEGRDIRCCTLVIQALHFPLFVQSLGG